MTGPAPHPPPLSKRQLVHLCNLLRRYAAELRYRRGFKEADTACRVVSYLEDYIATMHVNTMEDTVPSGVFAESYGDDEDGETE